MNGLSDAWCSIFCLIDFSPGRANHQNRTQRASWTRHRSKTHPLIIRTRCGWIQLSGSNSCHLSSFTLWFAATLRWRKLLVEEKSHIQSYPCGRCFPCISHVLLAVLGARSRVSSVWQRKTHIAFDFDSHFSLPVDREPWEWCLSGWSMPWGYKCACSFIERFITR